MTFSGGNCDPRRTARQSAERDLFGRVRRSGKIGENVRNEEADSGTRLSGRPCEGYCGAIQYPRGVGGKMGRGEGTGSETFNRIDPITRRLRYVSFSCWECHVIYSQNKDKRDAQNLGLICCLRSALKNFPASKQNANPLTILMY